MLLDADGQHLPEEISRFVDSAASEPNAKIFIGYAHERHHAMPLVRRMVNRYMSGKISRVCGQQIPDTQCGFRMLHRDIIPEVLERRRAVSITKPKCSSSPAGKDIASQSVPITTVYSDEVSSIHPVRDTMRFFKLMRRYRNL